MVMGNFFDRFTTGCARFAGRPTMLVICLLLAGTGIVAYLSGDELFISGANISISIVTLLLLPILQFKTDLNALFSRVLLFIRYNGKKLREWRNWQTRKT